MIVAEPAGGTRPCASGEQTEHDCGGAGRQHLSLSVHREQTEHDCGGAGQRHLSLSVRRGTN